MLASEVHQALVCCTVVKGGTAAWSASRWQRRMEAPGRVRGMRRRHEPRGQPHFVLPPNLYPPVGGTFWFQIFIQASSPEIWSETISGSEEGPGGEVGWPVFGLPPSEKNLSAAAARHHFHRRFAAWPGRRARHWAEKSTPGGCDMVTS